MKIISKIFIVFFLIIFFLFGYLSLIGFETKRFNNQISKSIKKIDKNFEIELKEIKIILDPLNFSLNAKTVGTKLINKRESIEIEYLRAQIPINYILNQKFLIKNIEISTKSLKVKKTISFLRNFQNTPQLYLLEKIIKKGYLIANIKLNFDNNGKITNNFKINGILKDIRIDVLKRYKVNNLNLLFDYHQNKLELNDVKFNFNNINFISQNLNVQSLDNELKVEGELENKDLNLDKNNIDLFIKPYLKNLDVKKVNFSSKNKFSFKIDKKFKLNDLNLITQLKLKEIIFLNNYKLRNFFPKINKDIKLLNHLLEIEYEKDGLKLKGKGDVLLQKDNDKISYSIIGKKKKYDFSVLFEIKNNPLLIQFLNYEKKEKNELILNLKGNKNFNDQITFDSISVSEEINKINIEGLNLDENFKILNLSKAEFNYLDNDNKKNQFKIIKKNNDYYLNGSAFNSNNLIQKIIDDEEDQSNIINSKFKLNIKVDELFLDKNYRLNNFKGYLSFDNQKIINSDLVGYFSKNKKMKFTVKTNGQEKITTLFLDEAEPIINRYKFIKGFNKGTLDFYSVKTGNQSKSSLKIYDFKLKKLPVLTKILTLASLQGIADILSGEGISFDEFEMNFSNKKKLMNIDEIYAIGPAISVLMKGYVEKNKVISLRGTLVPATTINKAIGSIPVLGQILVGSKTGEGVFGVSFKIKGPPKNLETTVNPIKTLTPRFITRTLEKIKKN